MKKFMKIVAFVAALVMVPAYLSDPLSTVDFPVIGRLSEIRVIQLVPLLMIVGFFTVRGLRKHDFNSDYVTRLTTNWVYFLSFFTMTVMAKNGNFAAVPWYTLAVVVTAALAWRTWAQEKWLRRLDDTGETVHVRATGRFAAVGIARANNPAFFRWAHRVLAVTWIWTVIPGLVADGSTPYDDNVAFLIMPACFLLMGGFAAAIFMALGFPFLILFAFNTVGGLWWFVLVLWLMYSAFLRPHDGRTNQRLALLKFEREAAWGPLH